MFPEYFNTSGLQSAFKIGSVQIYGTLEIVASHYVQWGSKVGCACALLEMSKAFDMIDHGHLFDMLLYINSHIWYYVS